MNRLPKRPLYLLIVLLGLALFPTASTAGPTELVRYHGDGSSATGAALANAERCDVNGDGLDDAVVGAWFWDKAPLSNIGAAYVIPGTDSAKGGSLNNPAAAGAVRIDGPQVANAFVGFAVGCLGDVNGDGFDDIGISHYTAQKAYVVFGAEDFTAVDLGLLGSRGFEVRGNSSSGNVGYSLAPVGDLDGDGLDEFGIAEVVADTQGRTNNGRIWVVSGQDDIADVDLTDPATGQIRLAVDGAYAEERLGVLSAVGDVNGDGKDDFLVGSYTSTPWGSSVAVPGSAAVIWGGTTGVVDLADLGGRGFRIFGPTRGRDRLGISVAGAGDVNGDGKADLLIGADGVYNAATGERNGSAFVVFGSASNETVYTSAPANDTVAPATGPAVYTCDDDPGTGTCADPVDLHGRGYRIAGAVSNDSTAYSVAGIGDVSGDGIPDLAIGAYGYDPVNPANPSATMSGAGAVWVVYGKADTDTQLLADLDEEAGYRIDGLAAGDRMGRQVAGLGDFDGNGAPDFVAGGDFASRPLSPGTPLSQAGEVILALNGPLATATGLEVTPEDQVAPGQSFDLTATAHRRAGSGSEVDAGTFRFTVDGNTINGCGAIPAGPGGATCADIRPGARGEHVFAAAYSGAGDHLASDGEAVPVRVVDSSLTELDQPAGPVVGQRPVAFLARVTGGGAGPVVNAGTVAFALDGEAIAGCGSVAVTAGKARCETTIATIGDREIGATYSGSTDLEGSAADPVTQAVVAGPSSRVELDRTPTGPARVGAEMTFRAEVWAAGQPADLGAVTFKAGGSPVESCASVPLTDGSAECVTAFPERGRRDVTAEYVSGSIAIGDSVSDPTSVEVRDGSSIVLSADRTTVEAGEAVTVTSAVAAQHGGTVEGGTVRLESDGCFGCGRPR